MRVCRIGNRQLRIRLSGFRIILLSLCCPGQTMQRVRRAWLQGECLLIIGDGGIGPVLIKRCRALLHQRPEFRVPVALLDIWPIRNQPACLVEQVYRIVKFSFIQSNKRQADDRVSIIRRLVEHLLELRFRIRQLLFLHLGLRDAELGLCVLRMKRQRLLISRDRGFRLILS